MKTHPCQHTCAYTQKYAGDKGVIKISPFSILPDPLHTLNAPRPPLPQVVRCICIMSHPVPNTDNAHSVQIILPQSQIGRRSDMYLFCCSYAHNVAPNGKWLAFVSTTVETENPEAELAPGLALLGPVDHKFVFVTDVNVPLEDGSR